MNLKNKKEVVLIKLGGSLITDKKQAYTTRPEIIKNLVKEIKESVEAKPDLRIVVGNGAGSFAHQSAQKYGTKNGFQKDDKESKFGFCVVQDDASRLNRIIVKEFLEQGVSAVSLQPSAIFINQGKSPVIHNYDTLVEFLNLNLLPVLYGDPVLDFDKGSTIYSTDLIVEEVAKFLKLEKGDEFEVKNVINAGDYDGVEDVEGALVKEITRQNFEEVAKNFYESDTVDVTGGMRYKVEEFLNLADIGIVSSIINGSKSGLLKKAVLEDEIVGTVIR